MSKHISESIQKKRGAAEEIKSSLRLHKSIEYAMKFNKLVILSLLAATVYGAIIGLFNQYLFLLSLGAILIQHFVKIAKVDMENAIYNLSTGANLEYDDVAHDSKFNFYHYKQIMNSHEYYRLKKLANLGAFQVSNELSGDPSNNYVVPLPRNVIQNRRDVALREVIINKRMSELSFGKAWCAIVVLAAMSTVYPLLANVMYYVNGFYVLLMVFTGMLALNYLIQSIEYNIKYKVDSKTIDVFTEGLGGN